MSSPVIHPHYTVQTFPSKDILRPPLRPVFKGYNEFKQRIYTYDKRPGFTLHTGYIAASNAMSINADEKKRLENERQEILYNNTLEEAQRREAEQAKANIRKREEEEKAKKIAAKQQQAAEKEAKAKVEAERKKAKKENAKVEAAEAAELAKMQERDKKISDLKNYKYELEDDGKPHEKLYYLYNSDDVHPIWSIIQINSIGDSYGVKRVNDENSLEINSKITNKDYEKYMKNKNIIKFYLSKTIELGDKKDKTMIFIDKFNLRKPEIFYITNDKFNSSNGDKLEYALITLRNNNYYIFLDNSNNNTYKKKIENEFTNIYENENTANEFSNLVSKFKVIIEYFDYFSSWKTNNDEHDRRFPVKRVISQSTTITKGSYRFVGGFG